MVVVPTLLLNEKQVHRLVDDLEVRYLGNSSRNLHFALLSDMPDSAETPNEDDPLVELCGAPDSRSSTRSMQATAAARFRCSIAIASTIRAKACGWAGSASAASCSTSTG